ncbi:MAG: nitronate monooxygenase [bacterium]|nr:nitronate monooxygenase [bacterium]
MNNLKTKLTEDAGISVPVICGPMFPCSNPELVAAVSDAGALGMIQPMSLTSIHGYDFRDGLQHIKSLTDKPVGMNILLEHAFKKYQIRMDSWIDIALEEGVRFFLTALGHPGEITKRIHDAGGIVYHDVVNRHFALKAAEAEVDGLVCVNKNAGGHAGDISPEDLFADLEYLGLPVVCAGGISRPEEARAMIDLGYAGVQMGTRFIATRECTVHADYQQAIIDAVANDIVLTEKISGVPVAVINNEAVQRMGTHASGLSKKLLRHPKTKKWMRMFYMIKSMRRLPQASYKGSNYQNFYQAGRSVGGIDKVLSAADVVQLFADELTKKTSE